MSSDSSKASGAKQIVSEDVEESKPTNLEDINMTNG